MKQQLIKIFSVLACFAILCGCEATDNEKNTISPTADMQTIQDNESNTVSQTADVQTIQNSELSTKTLTETDREVIKMGTIDLMQNVSTEAPIYTKEDIKYAPEAIYDFALDLFQKSFKQNENTMLSPISIVSALAMTANGAANNTLKQMEDTFGSSIDELNFFLHNYMKNLPTDSTNKLDIANSIWVKNDERFKVNEDFLKKNAAYYNAGIFNADFDAQTLKDINNWIEEKTQGMIKDMLDSIPADAIMYLINAVAFNAEWQNVYFEHQVRDGIFTNSSGEKEDASLMFSSENNYIKLDNAQGFIKPYKDNEYAFAAILPDENLSLNDFVSSLDATALLEAIKTPEYVKVDAAIPKFKSEYSIEMSSILSGLGMADAFDAENADFSELGLYANGENNIFISRVLHKTFIAVDEKGTEAGAATIVEMAKATSFRPPEDIKTVYLDRPFIYMIIDCESCLPLFIGAVESISQE